MSSTRGDEYMIGLLDAVDDPARVNISVYEALDVYDDILDHADVELLLTRVPRWLRDYQFRY